MNNKAKIDCVDRESRTNETGASVAVESVSVEKRQGLFEERPLPVNEIDPRVLRYRTRRDFILFGAGAMAALAGGGFLLPQDTLRRMGVRRAVNSPAKEWFLNRALRIDDDVAEALYSGNRRVPTYTSLFDHLRKIDITFVIVLTSHGYGSTKAIEHRLAAADVHAAHEARQPAGGSLAKAPTLWNRAAG